MGDAPIVAVLDLHGNPSPEFADGCDAVLGYDTYPHVDAGERGEEACALMDALLHGDSLVTRLRKIPLLTSPIAQDTSAEPMRGLLDRASERAAANGLARISLLPGFPYSDVSRAGFSIVAVAADGRVAAAERVLAEVVADVDANSDAFAVEALAPEHAVSVAARASVGPVVLVDLADNVGGGGGGDSTVLLRELLAQGVEDALLTIADREAAAQCHAAGRGAIVDTELGGKSGPLAGERVLARARVTVLSDGDYVAGGSWETGQRFSMGPSTLLELDGRIRILVTARAVPPFHLEQLTSLGADPSRARLVTAKGALAWKAALAEVAATVIFVDTPGACPADPWSLPRSTMPMAWG